MTTQTVREAVADALLAEGVDRVFALMGDGNLELICDLGERCGIPIVLGRHEQGVVAMADGYSRFSGRIGLATVTQGPGLTNAATSLTVAARHPSPVLLIAGDVPVGDRHNPQRFEQDAFGRLTAGASARLESAHSLDEVLGEAFGTLRAGSPFLLTLPADVQRAELAPGWRYRRCYATAQPVCAPAERVEEAAALLAGARAPVVLAGRGAVVSGAGEALGELAELLGAPLMTTLLAHGLFAGHRLDAGVLGGLGDGRALRAIEPADVVLSVGAGLNQWTTHFGEALAGRTVIRVDADPRALGSPLGEKQLAVHGDAAATARALIDRVRSRGGVAAEECSPEGGPREPRDSAPYLDIDGALDPRRVLEELDRAMPAARSVVIGGGHAAQIACYTLGASGPRDWTCTSVDFGAIGQGLGAAIGACLARPHRRVVHVTADGEFMMGIAELDTAVRHRLALTIIVLNDEAMGQERHNLLREGLPPHYAAYPSPDLVALARAYGADGHLIDNVDGLEAIRAGLEHNDGVVIIDARINGEYLNPVSREIAAHLK